MEWAGMEERSLKQVAAGLIVVEDVKEES